MAKHAAYGCPRAGDRVKEKDKKIQKLLLASGARLPTYTVVY